MALTDGAGKRKRKLEGFPQIILRSNCIISVLLLYSSVKDILLVNLIYSNVTPIQSNGVIIKISNYEYLLLLETYPEYFRKA